MNLKIFAKGVISTLNFTLTHQNHKKKIEMAKMPKSRGLLSKLLFVFEKESNVTIHYGNCEVRKTMNSSFCTMVSQKGRI